MDSGLKNKPNSNIIKLKSEQYWLVVRFFIAVLLLVTAMLKFLRLISEPSLGIDLFHAR
jgi:hypothetical protein